MARRARALALAVCLALAARARAQALAEHFWMNAGGGGLPRFGPDRVDDLVGGDTRAVTVAPDVPLLANWDASRSARVGTGDSFGYDLPLAESGVYACGVHLIELEDAAPGARVFSVEVNGVGTGSVDVVEMAGQRTAMVRNLLDIPAEDSVLRVRLQATVGEPMLSALTCSRVGAAPGPLPDASASPLPPDVSMTQAPTTLPPATTALPGGVTTSGVSPGGVSVGEPGEPGEPGPMIVNNTVLDLPPELEDDQFAQSFSLLVESRSEPNVSLDFIDTMKRVVASESDTATTDWAVVNVTGTDVSASVRQAGAGSAANTFVMDLIGRLPMGPAGTAVFDSVVSSVESGGVSDALNIGGFSDVADVTFASPPLLSAEANTRAAPTPDAGDSGSNRGAVIGGSVAAALVLLMLLGCAGYVLLQRGARGSSRASDDIPSGDISGAVAPDSDVEAGYTGPVPDMDDPDSRLTSAGSDDEVLVEEARSGGGVNDINKDVWGRGTGSDF